MAEIKLIITDLDGTYVNQGHISEENKHAVRLAQQRGVKVMACTGRTWTMCDTLIPTLGFDDYCVTSNGASIVHTESGEIVHRMRLKAQWLQKLFYAAMESSCPFDVFCGPFIHTYSPLRSQWTKNSEARAKMNPDGPFMKLRHFEDFENWFTATRNVAELFRVEVNPGAPCPDGVNHVLEALGIGKATTSFVDHWDINHPEATKENAMDFICNNLGILKENVMALGDSNNDTGMIRHAGLGVAMGSGAQEVKQAANVIAPSCEEDGFAWAIHTFVLNAGE